MLPDFILGIDHFGKCCAWPVWVEINRYLGNNTAISSLSFDRHLNNQHWKYTQTKLQKIGNSAIEYTGNHFIAVKASSVPQIITGVLHLSVHPWSLPWVLQRLVMTLTFKSIHDLDLKFWISRIWFRCKKDTWHVKSNYILQLPKYLIIIVNWFRYINNNVTTGICPYLWCGRCLWSP